MNANAATAAPILQHIPPRVTMRNLGRSPSAITLRRRQLRFAAIDKPWNRPRYVRSLRRRGQPGHLPTMREQTEPRWPPALGAGALNSWTT